MANPMAPAAAASAQSTRTALRSDRPMATSRWDEWSRPPRETGRPESRRDTVTNVVSKIGISNTSIGAPTIDRILDRS